jgi:hypothetical protein
MRIIFMCALIALAGCQQNSSVAERATPVNAVVAVGSPTAPIAYPAPAAADRTPIAEPTGKIDPKGPDGAGQVVQRYASLIEGGKIAEAQAAWGKGIEQGVLAPARLAALHDVRFEVGKPYDQEGAAGSSYIMVPLTLTATDKAGKPIRYAGPITLRRVNDVDGASAAQLRWHMVQGELVATR